MRLKVPYKHMGNETMWARVRLIDSQVDNVLMG